MKRGEQAREAVKNTIIEAFSKDGNFICVQDKKIYVQAKDGNNNEMIQFSIALTMPKNAVAAPNTSANTDWREASDSSAPNIPKTPVSLSPEDEAKVRELMQKLGVEDV